MRIVVVVVAAAAIRRPPCVLFLVSPLFSPSYLVLVGSLSVSLSLSLSVVCWWLVIGSGSVAASSALRLGEDAGDGREAGGAQSAVLRGKNSSFLEFF